MNICSTVVIKGMDGTFYKGNILCTDIFEDNLEFKACLMIDFETDLSDKFFDNSNIEYIIFTLDVVQTYMYGFLNIERLEDKTIDLELNDVCFDEEFRNGSVSRFWIFCENPSSIQLLNGKLESIDDNTLKVQDYRVNKELFGIL